jgi:TP901 family phage tail tape measure protein
LAGVFNTGIRIKAIDRLSRVLDKVKGKMPGVGNQVKKLNNKFKLLSKSTEKFRKKMSRLGGSLKGIGSSMSLGVTAPIAAFGAFSLKAAGDFEAAMKDVEGKTGATGASLEALKEKAKELGATTQFSANEAGQAFGFLAQAGLNADQILKAGTPTIELAAAAQLDLATAADLSTNVLAGYGMEVEELTRLNDRMVKTANSSNTSVTELGEAMKIAGPIFSSQNQPISETLGLIGELANNGIKASEAGVSLRMSMSALLKPTKSAKDTFKKLKIPANEILNADGSVKNFTDTIQLLSKRGATATDLINIFGARHGPKLIPLLKQGGKALDGLSEKIEDSVGESTRIAGLKMEGFNGAMKSLKSAVEALSIALTGGGVLESLTSFINKLAGGVRVMAAWVKENPKLTKMILIFAGIAAALGPVLFAIGTLLTMLPFMVQGFNMLVTLGPLLKAGFMAAGTGLRFLLGPVGLFITAAALIIANWTPIKTFFSDLWNEPLKTTKEFFQFTFEGLKKLANFIPGVNFKSKFEQEDDALRKQGFKFGGPSGQPAGSPAGAEAAQRNVAQNNSEFLTRTNNARVDVFVKAPEGTKVIGQGENGAMSLNTGMAGAF